MKFYVTGRSSNYDRVKAVFAKVIEGGHEVTFEWTTLPMVKPYSENVVKAQEFAALGITGVVEADAYIIFAHGDGNGVFTEFGAALAAHTINGRPRIMAIGDEHKDATMFFMHPAVEWFDSIEEVFAELNI